MILDAAENVHLTYCTNVHPSESWPEVEACLRSEVTAVKQLISPSANFGVGLRLSALAAHQLLQDSELERLQSLLTELGLYVFTINGFPYGPFHGEPVKEAVYEPDWRSSERAQYTDRLRHILGQLLPQGMTGSISTVPGGFRESLKDPSDHANIASAWLRQAAELWKLKELVGQDICLAIEPEPCCLLETTAELVQFFESFLLTPPAFRKIKKDHGLSLAQAEDAVRTHLGICLDTCHAAVEFEDPHHCLALLSRAGIRVAKVQLSCGLKIPSFKRDALPALKSFEDDVYLHQVVVKRNGSLHRYLDLPDALAKEADLADGAEWRVHFHVPIFRQHLGEFESTQAWLQTLLHLHSASPISKHLEVETYTWGVLPPSFQEQELPQAIARELSWVKGELEE